MTTTVKVTAHCAQNIKVVVTLNSRARQILFDGEYAEFYVYDNREITVKEVPKQEGDVSTAMFKESTAMFKEST